MSADWDLLVAFASNHPLFFFGAWVGWAALLPKERGITGAVVGLTLAAVSLMADWSST